jgi:hypothetical protein
MPLILTGTSSSTTLDSSAGLTFSDSSNQSAAASPYGLKNRIINGDMRIDQRNAGVSVTPAASTYTLDRWRLGASAASKVSVQQSSTAPIGFNYSTVITTVSAYTLGASEEINFGQRIEGYNTADLGWGTADAKTVTLSFWVRSSLTGTFGGVVTNSARTRSYPFSYTISVANTWEQKSVTIAGDTSGTWETTSSASVYVQFGIGTGSALSGPAGSWASTSYSNVTGAVSVVGTASATFYITGVQLEVGSSATPFERRLYNQELANCQRYYEKSYNYETALGSTDVAGNWTSVGGNSYPRATQFFKVEKRATPTMTFYADSNGSTGNVNAWDNGTVRIAAASNIFITTKHTCPEMDYASALSARASMYFNWVASSEL